MVQNEQVPFDGQLLTKELAILQSQKAHWCDDHTLVEVRRCQRMSDEQIEHRRKMCEIETAGLRLEVSLLQRRLEEVYAEREGPWYRHPLFVSGISVLGTVGAIWAGVQVVSASSN